MRLTLLLIMLFLAARPVAAQDNASVPDIGSRRLQTIEELAESKSKETNSFLKHSPKHVNVWLQETKTYGRMFQFDLDEWNARTTIKFGDLNKQRHDLNRVLIVTRNGSSIRLLDLDKEDFRMKRGDVIAIMRVPDAK